MDDAYKWKNAEETGNPANVRSVFGVCDSFYCFLLQQHGCIYIRLSANADYVGAVKYM